MHFADQIITAFWKHFKYQSITYDLCWSLLDPNDFCNWWVQDGHGQIICSGHCHINDIHQMARTELNKLFKIGKEDAISTVSGIS